MKKLLTLIAVSLFVFQFANAQTEKGSQTLGLDLSVGSNTNNQIESDSFDPTPTTAKTTVSNFSIGPAYSYFIANKLDLGASLQYSSNVENDYPVNGMFGEKETVNDFGATIFVRKYCMFTNKLGIRTGPYLSYMHEDDKDVATGADADPSNNLDTKTNNYEAGINLGLVYFPSKKLGFSATLANLEYDHYKMNETPSTDSENGNSINFNFINSGLSLSVFFVFGSK